MKYTYLLVDIGSILIPFIFSFHKRLRFDQLWKAFWPACLITAFIFIVWDMLYTDLGVWGFNPKYLTGIHIGNLPLEEVLFFICIPYACVFSYHTINQTWTIDPFKGKEKWISSFLILGLSIIGIWAFPKLYTSVTFLVTALAIFIFQFVFKSPWLHRFYLAYLVLLIPFFMVNGILTGTGIEDQIVWYDDTQNLGIRMLTIPVEDTFYGLLLILLNVALFERFKKSIPFSLEE